MGKQIDVALDIGNAKEVPGDVQHAATPGKARKIPDRAGGDHPLAWLGGWLLD